MTTQIHFGLLGPVLASHAGTAVPINAARQRSLLAALLLRANHPVSTDELADQIWDGAPPASAATTVRSYLMRLRQALGPVLGARLRTRPFGYLVEIHDDAELDIRLFATRRRAAQAATLRGDWPTVATELHAAIGLWRGSALADLPAGGLKDRELTGLGESWVQANESLARAELELGRSGAALERVIHVQREHPYREQLASLLMRAQVAEGRPAEALAEYARLRQVLVAELGIEPGADPRAVQAAILAGTPLPPLPGPATVPVAGPVSVAVPVAVAVPVPRQLPGPLRHFVGRAAEVRALNELLDPSGTTTVAAVSGMAGAGKTALAVCWAHQQARHFPDGQLYVDLRGFDPSATPVTTGEVIRGFLAALGVDATRLPVDAQAQVALYRSLLAERQLLVLLDNARDDEQVRQLLPAGARCRAVVTSRTRLTGLVTTEGARLLTLGPLAAEQIREIFRRHLGQERVAAEPAAVEELSGWCASLPLAASVVAARAAAGPHHSLAAVAKQLRDARTRLGVWETGDAATDLRTVFSWSCRQLSAPALRLFRLLGVGPGADFTVATAASLTGLGLPAAATAVAELARAHLVNEVAPGRFSSHDLLRAYAAELADQAESAAARRAATHRVLDHHLHAAHRATLSVSRYARPIEPVPPQPGVTLPDVDGTDALSWFDTELPALLAAVDRAEQAGFDVHAWQLSWCLMSFFDLRGRWQDLAATQRVALRSALRLGDRLAEAWAHRALGYAHGRMGDHEPARTHLLAAANAFEALGAAAACARSHQALAWILGLHGEHAEAMAHARRSLHLVPVDSRPSSRANALNTLGRCHAYLGEYDNALLACRQALALHEQADDAYGVAEAHYSLGLTHQLAGDHVPARAGYQHALELFQELGDRHYIGETLTGLADVSAALGDAACATRLWRRALVILTDTRHPDADRVRHTLDRASVAS